MTCSRILHITGGAENKYEFEHNGVRYLFEWHHYNGPSRLRKRDYNPWDRSPGEGFWQAMDAWVKLTREEKEKYRVK